MAGVGTSFHAVDFSTSFMLTISPVSTFISINPTGSLVVLKESSPFPEICFPRLLSTCTNITRLYEQTLQSKFSLLIPIGQWCLLAKTGSTLCILAICRAGDALKWPKGCNTHSVIMDNVWLCLKRWKSEPVLAIMPCIT